MSVSPKEVMKSCIVLFDGQPRVIKGAMEYIILEGSKEWIGGGLMNGEPLTHEWAEKLSFTRTDKDDLYWADPKSSRILYISPYSVTGSWVVKISVSNFEFVPLQVIQYVHQLQVLFFGIIGYHLPLPKLPKK